MILTDSARADFDIPGLSSPEEARSKQQIIVLPHNGFTLPGGLSVAWREAASRYIRAAGFVSNFAVELNRPPLLLPLPYIFFTHVWPKTAVQSVAIPMSVSFFLRPEDHAAFKLWREMSAESTLAAELRGLRVRSARRRKTGELAWPEIFRSAERGGEVQFGSMRVVFD